MIEHLDIFACPVCLANLAITENSIRCLGCHKIFKTEDGIPLLYWPSDSNQDENVTNIVKSFYEKTPFPNYEETENIMDLRQKARKGVFARLLDEQIPFNIRIIEVGCGTGQLSNFLSIPQRFVFGTDICLNSLKLANRFKIRNGLQRVGFYQMNLFKPIFKEESFPLVICNGVLHHTNDPFGGFRSISKLVKKSGYIIIGLYNRYGRINTDIRRTIFNIFGDRFKFLDPQLRKIRLSNLKKNTWFMDQYKHPHEFKLTVDEVLGWFEKCGFDFINSMPKFQVFKEFSENEKLFEKKPKGNILEHLIIQTHMLFSGTEEGGFFIMIGRKR
ncbi:MAG: methyltransferase domain-containing protein [Candidatus Omnitrophica bacterium]|nr:methyltransferase domain-containing protein [Candidatus Omnitrophota bacterium]